MCSHASHFFAADLDLAAQALKSLLDLNRGDAKALRGELVDLMVQRFEQSAKTSPASKGAEAALFKLANEIVEHALALGQAYRSELNFAAAERAEQKAVKPATMVGSPQLPQLRQCLAVDEMLAKLVSMARGHEQRKMTEQAVSEYLDAGLVDEAARLNAQEPNETVGLLIQVAQFHAAAPADLLAAAKAWDKRATAAKVRLQAIHQKLGDMAGALRKQSEWVYLVDLQEVSAKVGWGAFQKVKRGGKPVGIAGRAFATGLYVHAPSRVVYLLRGQYSEFSFCYGMGTVAGGAASFEVLCERQVDLAERRHVEQPHQGRRECHGAARRGRGETGTRYEGRGRRRRPRLVGRPQGAIGDSYSCGQRLR